MRRSQFFVVTFVLGAAGCVGGIGSGGSSERPGATPPGSSPGSDPNAAGPMPLRRLTRREYNNTVRDLLGDTSQPADALPARPRTADFTVPARRAWSPRRGLRDHRRRRRGAGAGRRGTFADAGALHRRAPTRTPARATSSTSFGLRAYRRPLVRDEVDRPWSLYREGRGAGRCWTHAGGIRLLIEGDAAVAGLPLPLGAGAAARRVEGKVVRLGPYENASRLSYFLWGSMPDQALFDAAAAEQAGHPGRARGAGPPHAGRPARPRDTRGRPSSRSGWAWTRWPSGPRTRRSTPSGRTT